MTMSHTRPDATRAHGSFSVLSVFRKSFSKWTSAAAVCGAFTMPTSLSASSLTFLTNDAAYTTGSLVIGAPIAGPLTPDVNNPNRLFVAVGSFGAMSVLSVDKTLGTTTTVTPTFGSIGGLASLSNGDLVIVDNFFPQTILRARDLDSNGAFTEVGEIAEIIVPAFVDGPFGFSGAQAIVAPPGNPSAIPSGSLLVQTADGSGRGEVLVITDPQTSGSSSYLPLSGQPFVDGLDFNGGIAFDSQGNLIVGSSAFPNPGRIFAAVNSNGDDRITTPSELNLLLGGPALADGASDLAVTADDRVIQVNGSGVVRQFALPANRLTGQAGPVTTLAELDSPFLSAVVLDPPTASFIPGGSGPKARLWIAGTGPLFSQTRNLLWMEPGNLPSSIQDWALYE